MNNKQMKKATVDAINVMISHADKGPSGFWVEDHEGCGNPAVFPEFEEGLKRGRLIQKKHYFCPWNTAIMYGDGHGNINTGCYHSCSISKARYLTTEELKEVLVRFKTRMENGDYDCVEHLSPLLTKDESRHIEDRILAKQHECERCERQKRQERLKKAAALIAKYPDEESLLAIYYGEKDCVLDEGGIILFDPASQRNVVGAEKFSYNDYLDVQFASLGKKHRPYFSDCFFNAVMSHFKGFPINCVTLPSLRVAGLMQTNSPSSGCAKVFFPLHAQTFIILPSILLSFRHCVISFDVFGISPETFKNFSDLFILSPLISFLG